MVRPAEVAESVCAGALAIIKKKTTQNQEQWDKQPEISWAGGAFELLAAICPNAKQTKQIKLDLI